VKSKAEFFIYTWGIADAAWRAYEVGASIEEIHKALDLLRLEHLGRDRQREAIRELQLQGLLPDENQDTGKARTAGVASTVDAELKPGLL